MMSFTGRMPGCSWHCRTSTVRNVGVHHTDDAVRQFDCRAVSHSEPAGAWRVVRGGGGRGRRDVDRSSFLTTLAPLKESSGGGDEAQAYCDSNGDRESYSHDCHNTSWRSNDGSSPANAEGDPVHTPTISATSSSLSSFSRQYSSSPVRSAMTKSSPRRTTSNNSRDPQGGGDGVIRSDRSSPRSRRG